MNQSITNYKMSLRKHLYCTGDVKKRLLEKADRTMQLYLEENPDPNESSLRDAFGVPEDFARILMNEVTEIEIRRYRRIRTVRRVMAAIVLAAFVASTIYIYFIKQSEIIVQEEIIPGTKITTDSVY